MIRPYLKMAEWATAFVLLAGLFVFGYREGAQAVQQKWNLDRAAQTQALAEARAHLIEVQQQQADANAATERTYADLKARNDSLARALSDSLRAYITRPSGGGVPKVPDPASGDHGTGAGDSGAGEAQELAGLASAAVSACAHTATVLTASQDWITRQRGVK